MRVHYGQTKTELEAQELSIKDLAQAIADQEDPLALAEERLALRAQRPNIELVRDAAHRTLPLHASVHCVTYITHVSPS